jgi:hypothetical protein
MSAVFLGEQNISAEAQTKPADRLKAIEAIYPPWQHGKNNDAIDRGGRVATQKRTVVAQSRVVAECHPGLQQDQEMRPQRAALPR